MGCITTLYLRLRFLDRFRKKDVLYVSQFEHYKRLQQMERSWKATRDTLTLAIEEIIKNGVLSSGTVQVLENEISKAVSELKKVNLQSQTFEGVEIETMWSKGQEVLLQSAAFLDIPDCGIGSKVYRAYLFRNPPKTGKVHF